MTRDKPSGRIAVVLGKDPDTRHLSVLGMDGHTLLSYSLKFSGRPLIALQINNIPIDCFCDTGTADSILNPCFGHTLESDPVTAAVCTPPSRVSTRPLQSSGVGGGH